MEGVLASFAQFDNDVRLDRPRAGMKTALELGRWTFLAPIGYLNVSRSFGCLRHLRRSPGSIKPARTWVKPRLPLDDTGTSRSCSTDARSSPTGRRTGQQSEVVGHRPRAGQPNTDRRYSSLTSGRLAWRGLYSVASRARDGGGYSPATHTGAQAVGRRVDSHGRARHSLHWSSNWLVFSLTERSARRSDL